MNEEQERALPSGEALAATAGRTEAPRDEAADSRRRRGRWAYVLLAALLPALATFVYIITPTLADKPLPVGFPLDDSWIHAVYARTIVEGHPFEYRPGTISNGTTAPVFALLVAGVAWLTGEYVYTIHGVNVVLMALFGVLLYLLLRRFALPRIAALLGVGLIAISWPIPWGGASGMEIPLTLVLLTLTVWLHLRECAGGTGWAWLVPVTVALLGMSRPEFFALWPMLELDRALIRWRTPPELRRDNPLPRTLLRLLLFGAVFTPYAAFNYQCNGTFLTNSLQTVVGERSILHALHEHEWAEILRRFTVEGPRAVRKYVNTVLAFHNKPLAVAGIVGIVLWLRGRERRPRALDSLLVPAVALALPYCIGVVTRQLRLVQAQRTLHGEIVFVMIIGVLGIHVLATLAQGSSLRRAPRAVGRRYAAVLLLATAVGAAWIASEQRWAVLEYGIAVKNIQDCEVHLGKWVAQNVPEGEPVATCDIGAIAFFGRRPVVDTQGLIDPDLIPLRHPGRGLPEELRRRGVRWVIVFPKWHQDISETPLYTERYRVHVKDNLVCYGDVMIVYEAVDGPPSPGQRDQPPGNADEARSVAANRVPQA